MARFLMIRFSTSLLFGLLLANVSAEPASDAQMAREAIAPYFSAKAEATQNAIDWHRDQLRSALESDPHLVRPARVFFTQGLSLSTFAKMASDFGVEVIDVSLKAPLGDRGVVMSISNGMTDLLVVDGPLLDRLTTMVRRFQNCFKSRSRYMQPEDAAEYMKLSSEEFRVYSARLAGDAPALMEIQKQDYVRVVALRGPDVPPDLLETFESAKKHAPIDRPIFENPAFGLSCDE